MQMPLAFMGRNSEYSVTLKQLFMFILFSWILLIEELLMYLVMHEGRIKLTTEELLQYQSPQGCAGTRASHTLEQRHSAGRSTKSSTYKLSDPV